jgi:hypothetical protein
MGLSATGGLSHGVNYTVKNENLIPLFFFIIFIF